MSGIEDLRLYSPEEISEQTGGHLKPYTLRRLAREGKIACVRAERDRILFTTAHIKQLLQHWSVQQLAFTGTSRSRKARRSVV